MCGRYALYDTSKLDFEVAHNLIGISYNIAPSMKVPVIVENNEVSLVNWTYKVPWAKNLDIINARSETVRQKPSFKESKPCLIVADGWYEWKRDGEVKQPYYFHMNNDVFYFAGIYNDSGCAILTMEANEKLAPIHHRQPIMLKHNEARDHLKGKDRFTSSLSRRVEFYPVDRMMNSPNVNNEKNIEECKI